MGTTTKNKPVKNKKAKARTRKIFGVISSEVGNYENDPFFVKKAKEAKELIDKYGLPDLSEIEKAKR